MIDDFPDKTCSPSERINRSRVNARRDRLMRCTIALSGRNTGDGHKGDRQGRLELRVQDIFRRFRARVRYPFSFRRAREDFEGKGQGDLEVQTAFPFPPPPSFLSFVDISRKLLGRKAKPDKIKKGKTHEIGGEESRNSEK